MWLTARFFCDIVIYCAIERIFSRQTFFESLWSLMDNSLLCFYWFLLKNYFFTRKSDSKIDSATATGGQGMLTYLMFFLWPPLEVGLTRSTFRFSFKCGGNLSFIICPLVLMRWSPKEITQHQALVDTIFYVYWDQEALVLFTCIFHSIQSYTTKIDSLGII